jgi:protocatechuate 3,4-dioxygenase alpha subunit
MIGEPDLIATASQTVGPFFHVGLRPAHGRPPVGDRGRDRIRLVVRIVDGDGQPLDDALVEFWEGGAQGDGVECGRMSTDPAGTCELDVARPRRHLNLCIFARGLLRQLYTRVYFPSHRTSPSDAVLSLVPAERRETLMARPDGTAAERWLFEIHLQGPQETVFFDR